MALFGSAEDHPPCDSEASDQKCTELGTTEAECTDKLSKLGTGAAKCSWVAGNCLTTGPYCQIQASCPSDGLKDLTSKATMEAGGWSFDTEDKANFFPGQKYTSAETRTDLGYVGWRGYDKKGSITATMKGSGKITLDLLEACKGGPWKAACERGSCWMKVYKNDFANPTDTIPCGGSKLVQLDYVDGDKIKVEEGFGVLSLKSVQIDCSARARVGCPSDGLKDLRSKTTMEAGGWFLDTEPKANFFPGQKYTSAETRTDLGYVGWRGYDKKGSITATMKGSGKITLDLLEACKGGPWKAACERGSCWMKVYKNDFANPTDTIPCGGSKLVQLDYVDGDKIKVEEGFGVLSLKNVQIEC